MPSPRVAAIQAVIDAWTDPGISPEYHQEWKNKLSAASEDGGWPVLARAVQGLVDAEEARIAASKRAPGKRAV